jgi:signal peptidase I
MEPTYRDGSFNFCFRLRYFFSEPQRRDVVTIRLAGESIMLLKRVVGLAGDVVAFKGGRLFVNQKPVKEPYLVYPSNWNLPQRTVKPGYVYVVGDNRSVPIEMHQFGQTPVKRIVGGPLW